MAVNLASVNLFYALLKEKRRRMSPGARKRFPTLKTARTTWINPTQYERKYRLWLTKKMRELTIPATIDLQQKLDDWVREQKIDRGQNVGHLDTRADVLYHTDDFATEFTAYMERLRADQLELFGSDKAKGNYLSFLIDLGYETDQFNAKQWEKFTKLAVGDSFFAGEEWVAPAIDTWAEENYTLIKSLSDEYVKKVNTIVSTGVQSGALTKDIMQEIRKTNRTMTRSRANLIARDQVGKLNGIFTKNRQADAGIEMYIWQTVGDRRVRGKPGGAFPYAIPSHNAINGALCRWDNNRVYSPDGGKTWKPRPARWPQTIPGMEIQCRCWGSPYFDETIRAIDKEIEEEAGL